MLSISLFDRFSVSSDDGPLPGFESARLQGLLGYLLLHRGVPQIRTHIAFSFWPDSDESQALTNLRNLLHLLRCALPGDQIFLENDRRMIAWSPKARVCVDIDTFDRNIEQAGSLHPGSPEACKVLEAAVNSYPGDLLPYQVAAWVGAYRDKYRRKFILHARRLLDLFDHLNLTEKAVALSERMMNADPLDETCARRLMGYYARMNDHASAVRTYLRLKAHYDAELGLAPSSETEGLYRRVLLHRVEPKSGREVRFSASDQDAFEEHPAWTAFQTTWNETINGRPHILLVKGEAGLGKTRLTRMIGVWARHSQKACQISSLHELDVSLQYAPIINLLRRIPAESLQPELRPELENWLPELRSSSTIIPLTDWSRTVLFESAWQALTNWHGPIILVLDNLQWCDPGTLEWLGYRLHAASGATTALIATLRPEEVPDHPTLERFISSLQREGLLSQVELQPFSPTETAHLARSVLGYSISPPQTARLQALSGGNPRYLLEWLKTAREDLLDPEHDPESISLPETLRILAEERLALLTPATRRLLPLAAAESTFTLTGLLQAAQVPFVSLAAALEEITLRGIAVEIGPERYKFRYPIFRKAILHGLNSTQWRLLSRQLASRNSPSSTTQHLSSKQ